MRLYILFAITCFSILLKGQPTVSFATVVPTGLSSPMQVVNAGDGTNRLFVVQKSGIIRVYDVNNNYSYLGNFLTVTGISTSGEQGLLSMAFHPEYYNNGYFFVTYVNSSGNLELARYKVSTNNINVADASSKDTVLTIPHPTYSNHNGGELHFGNDGFLYWSTGDGGHFDDPNNNAQNSSSLLGKILRLNVNTNINPPYYSIPSNNPFNNEVFVLGLRNPFRWSFDRLTKDMWIGDVGQDQFEEIDFLADGNILGNNLGWRCYEASDPYITGGCNSIYTNPIYEYPTTNTEKSIIGGAVYRGYEYPDLKGYYLAIDYYFNKIIKIKNISNQWVIDNNDNGIVNTTDFGESESGELFITVGSTLRKVASTGPAPTTYVFTGNGDWTSATNWRGNLIPPNPLPAGSQIVVKPRKNGLCNLNQIQVINEGADIFIEPGSIFDINSNLTILE